MERVHPDGTVKPRGRKGFTAIIPIKPSEYSDTYDVLFDHVEGKTPIVYVVRPKLERVNDLSLPHVYPLNTLCLHTRGERIPSIPMTRSLVPWASEWLYYYEMWLATGGEWRGGGVHPSIVSDATATEPRLQKHDEAKLRKRKRLESALAWMYGTDADIASLMYNTTV